MGAHVTLFVTVISALSILPAALLLAAPSQARGDVWEDAERGFRIERPGRDWGFREQSEAGTFVLDVHLPGAPGVGVYVEVRPDTGETPDQLASEAARRIEGEDTYSDFERGEERLARRAAPVASVTYRAEWGTAYRIRQAFLVEGGLRYLLQRHAPADEYAERERELDGILATFELLRADEETLARRKVSALAARCGTEIDWEERWARASRRARDEDKLILVHVRSYPGFDLTDAARLGLFMEPEVVELVNERFVALRHGSRTRAPYEARESYGMSPSTFGEALLAVTPEGEVVRQTSTVQREAAFDFLLECVARHPGYRGAPTPDGLGPLERAERHLARGEHEAAAALLEGRSSERAHFLKAGLHARRREGEAALAELSRAGSGDDVAHERIDLLLRLGRDGEAREIAAGLDASDPTARFWTGVLDQRAGDYEAAGETWRWLIERHPESRWAWKAAALRESTGQRLGFRLRTEWRTPDVLAAMRRPDPAPLPPSRAAEAERAALAFLLERQRTDGSWLAPSQVATGPREESHPPDPFVDAIAAIAGRALLLHADEPGALEAVERALAFLLASHARALAADERPAYMDYTVYSASWTLWFLADCLEAELGDRRELREVMRNLVDHLAALQQSNGGWSYYLTREIESGAAPASQSISFVTALVSLALHRAGEAGVSVPSRVRQKGLDVLEAMRDEQGFFEYMRHPGAGRPNAGPPGGAAGRSPVCELALFRAGRSDLDRLDSALESFARHRDGLAQELGKALMHAGPDTQGSHYLMFDYTFAAAAVGELPEEERGRLRTLVLELILDARSTEGGFRDTPINGWAYGTAMALIAFRGLG